MLCVSGLQILLSPFYFLATVREPTLALHMLMLLLLPSCPLPLPRNCGAGVSRTGGRRQNKSFLLWVVFLKYFVTVTKHYLICSLSQCMRISVISFMVFVCFLLHNPLLYSSCFSLSGFLPVSRSRIFTPLKCHLLLIFLGCDASRPSIARSFLSFRTLLKCHLFSKALHGSPFQRSFVSPATQTVLLSLVTSSS